MHASTRYSGSHSTFANVHLTFLAGVALLAGLVVTMPTWMPYILFSLVGGAPVSPGCDAVNHASDATSFEQTFHSHFFAGDTITIDGMSASGAFEVVQWVDNTGLPVTYDTAASLNPASRIVPENGEYSVTVTLPSASNAAPISSGRIHCTPGVYSPRGIDGKPVVPLFP